jgi:hypothetical protein
MARELAVAGTEILKIVGVVAAVIFAMTDMTGVSTETDAAVVAGTTVLLAAVVMEEQGTTTEMAEIGTEATEDEIATQD